MLAVKSHDLLDIQGIVSQIFGEDLHKKRQLSLAYAALGLLHSESLFVHEMGVGLASARGLNKKHTTKQIDRLLSNPGIDIWDLSASWVPYIIGQRTELMVALDWTSFADDSHVTICLNVLTSKGCSTPLLWQTVDSKSLKHNRARYEDQLLSRLKAVIPEHVKITVVADRGFADQKFFNFLENELKFNYIIRIKSNTFVTDSNGVSKKASEWLRTDGRIRRVMDGTITQSHYPVKQVICLQDRGMKAAWYLVTNLDGVSSRVIVKHYARRWKIEPYFRDIKDSRFGYGLRQTHIRLRERRDRLLLIVALCYTLLILLGQAGESIGFDKHLKVNTVKTRTHSLFRQGQYYYDYFRHFKQDEKRLLVESFGALLDMHDFWLTFIEDQK